MRLEEVTRVGIAGDDHAVEGAVRGRIADQGFEPLLLALGHHKPGDGRPRRRPWPSPPRPACSRGRPSAGTGSTRLGRFRAAVLDFELIGRLEQDLRIDHPTLDLAVESLNLEVQRSTSAWNLPRIDFASATCAVAGSTLALATSSIQRVIDQLLGRATSACLVRRCSISSGMNRVASIIPS